MPRSSFFFSEDFNARNFNKLQGISNLFLAGSYFRFAKKGKVQKLLHGLKYAKTPEVGELVGRWMGIELKQTWTQDLPQLILPVPLHPKKKRKRGYNQSDFIARGISAGLEIEWSDKILIRDVNNATQTRKSKIQRWHNVENVFRINNPVDVEDKHILLVDDVLTTGSTLEACAETLNDSGAAKISAVTLADAG